MRLSTILVVLVCSVANAAPPIAPPVDQNADYRANIARMNRSLDNMIGTIDNVLYKQAYKEAMTTHRPMLRWVNVECKRCIEQSKNEFVHIKVDSFEGSNKPRVIVSLPLKDGLEMVGEVDWWITGDPTYGHIPSSRRVIQQYKKSGKYEKIAGPPAPPTITMPQVQRVPVQYFQNAPAACVT